MDEQTDASACGNAGSAEKPSYRYDVFIAHAGADVSAAERLYELTCPPHRVFVDKRCLLPGDDWDTALARAQRDSRITAVLVSTHADRAFYLREEIATAIDMARTASHRVVPIYLDGHSHSGGALPYGLRLKHGLSVQEEGGLERVAIKLGELVIRLREAPDAAGDVTGGGGTAFRTPAREVAEKAPALHPAIHISGKVSGLNVVVGGTQTVHGDLRVGPAPGPETDS